jgi:LemA protein
MILCRFSMLFARQFVEINEKTKGRAPWEFLDYLWPDVKKGHLMRSAVAAAHGRADLRALGLAETELRAGLGQLFAVVENYPNLKADESFRHLQTRITQLEENIADRRELYNASVNLNNVRIHQFPDLVVARTFGFSEATLLEFTEEQKSDVDMKALFG